MKNNRIRTLFLIAVLITITGVTMAYSSSNGKQGLPFWTPPWSHQNQSGKGIVKISGHLVQDKILLGSKGLLNLALTLKAEDVIDEKNGDSRNVNMVIVLDRSGSMKGHKIAYARQAVLKLLSGLSPGDRFALVAYSDNARILTNLRNVTGENLTHLKSVVGDIRPGGGTNLSAGLEAGINLVLSEDENENAAKIILISDGLANRGTVDPQSIGRVAAVASENGFAVSTVGVGDDFNESLMTTIADRGSGNYYYLEDPGTFAEVFLKEFHFSRSTVATGVSVHIPLKEGISLKDASGYPVIIQDNNAVFQPGDLVSGQTRKIFLTLKVPSNRERHFKISDIKVRYLHKGNTHEVNLNESFNIACVQNRKKVLSSIKKSSWVEKVLKEDFNRLKQEIASDIKEGKKQHAMERLERYHDEQEAINATVGSAKVAKNLDEEVRQLRRAVEDTFAGAPAAVERKQKSKAKALQFDGYTGRRQK